MGLARLSITSAHVPAERSSGITGRRAVTLVAAYKNSRFLVLPLLYTHLSDRRQRALPVTRSAPIRSL